MEKDIELILERILGVKISKDSNRQNIDTWDSFNHLNIITELENLYNIQFTPKEMAMINSYQELLATLKAKIEK